MPDRIAAGIWQRRTAGALFLAFAGIAALLSAIGLYSVLSYLVSQQRREMGVRLALGARPVDVLRLVIGRGLRITMVGLLVGLVGAGILTGTVAALLHGVSPFDPLTFIAVPVLLAAVAILACYLPARRAARIDPIVAMKE